MGRKKHQQDERALFDTAAAIAKTSLHDLAAYRGYLKAHNSLQQPQPLLGGPIHVHIEQSEGGVHVALPAKRELDPAVFGTPDLPTAFGGTPILAGVPLQARGTDGDAYTQFKKLSPFGDKATVMADGKLMIDATDATATDAVKSNDKVKFAAQRQDPAVLARDVPEPRCE